MSRNIIRDRTALHFTVEGDGPVVILTGAPVGMSGFAMLADRLADEFTVVRHDPRGIGLSELPEDAPITVRDLADDVVAIIDEVTTEPVRVFGASGGAVVALDLLARWSSRVTRMVVHEPPLFDLLDDNGATVAAAEKMFATADDDPDAAFQSFFDMTEVMHETYEDHPRPSRIALPPLSAEDRQKQRFALGRMAPATALFTPAFDGLAKEKLTISAGAASVGQPARKAAEAVARKLGLPLMPAPGNHLAPSLKAEDFANWLKPLLRV